MKTLFQEYHLCQVLRGYEQQHLPLDLYLSHYFRSHKALGSTNRRFIAETIYGMTRWRGLIDHLIGKESSYQGRLSLYQAFQPHGFLHANQIPLHTRLSFPKELFNLLLDQYGETKAIELCQISNTQAPTTIRINPKWTTREALLTKWKGKYDIEPTPLSPFGINFSKRINFYEMPEFKQGWFEIQDEGSQLVVDLIQPKPKDQVLDFCAGAGGKTLAFAHQLEETGQLYLHDIRHSALHFAKKRLKRAGVQNAQILLSTSQQYEKLKKKMDIVIVDAPCSGTGTYRRNPDMKWKFSTQMLDRLIGQQRLIFERALSFVRPGGKIIYITCSLLKQENTVQVEHFKKTYPLKEKQNLSLLPAIGAHDGFFATSFILT